MLARVGWQKAAVALANKNVSILWAVLATGRAFAANQVPTKPGEIIRPVAAVRRHGSKVLSVSRTIDFPTKTCGRRCITQVRPVAGKLD